jgi:hypothetical protein
MEVQIGVEETGPDQDAPQLDVQPVEEDQQPSDRPEWLPEKFESSEDLAKAYSSLEKKMSSNKADEQGLLTAEQFQDYGDEYRENGGLSEDSYEALNKMGLSNDLVDQYIQGQEIMAVAEGHELMEAAGGEEGYNSMSEWAAENVPEDELDAYNQAVQGDVNMAKLAIRGMYAQYRNAGGQGPNLIQGGKSAQAGGYGSTYEMQQDMKNPLYKNGDQQFHAMVDRRLAATSGSVI